ncbi:MAG TPA: BMP family protein, partial [Actinomycetes bacterium]|nr:BMP family protein [Actinomycetes bacterium]
MRKNRLVAAVAGIPLALGLVACGGDGATGSPDATGDTPFRVAALLTGTENDGAISQAFVEGMKKAKDEHGIEIRMVGPVQSPDETMQQGAAFARDGYDLVFVVHSGLAESIPKLATEFPDTQFCAFFDEDPDKLKTQPTNVCYFDPEHQYGSFMGGVAAGLSTKTNHVGAVVGMDIPLATRQAQGFHLGAKCVNPNVRYTEAFTGDFNDSAKAKTAAQSLYGAGADILIAAVDSAVQGLFTVAESMQDRYVVPQYFDNHDAAPDVVLTSVLFGLDEIAQEIIEDAMAGSVERQYRFTDKFSLADFREHADVIGEDNIAKLEEIRAKVLAGEIKIPDE